jgi:hypothetical protein
MKYVHRHVSSVPLNDIQLYAFYLILLRHQMTETAVLKASLPGIYKRCWRIRWDTHMMYKSYGVSNTICYSRGRIILKVLNIKWSGKYPDLRENK